MTYDEAFKKLYETVVRLRAPEGCSWDREQTPLTLRDDLIEETYECVEAIGEGDPHHIKEELGDIFLLATMISYMHEQEGVFSVADALEEISEKLIRRHPHVFDRSAGPEPALSTDEILSNWAKIKVEQEGRKPKDSLLDEVSRGLPPLERAFKLQKKAAKVGFDWPSAEGVISKIREELSETEAAIIGTDDTSGSLDALALEGELGDLLFSVTNLCRFFGIDPSAALQRTNKKFTERFRHVEKRMKENCQTMNAQNLAAMDGYWNEAK